MLFRHVRHARVVVVSAAAALVGLGTLVGLATPASAHAHLISTDPAAGATLTVPPSQVRLTFDEPIAQAHLAVEGPDGARWDDGAPVAADRTVTQQLRPLGPAGAYAVNYRIVSSDGHPVQGTINFTLTAAASASQPAQPAQPATPGDSASQSAPPISAPTSPAQSRADPLWPALAVVLAVVAAGSAVAAVIRNRRRAPRR